MGFHAEGAAAQIISCQNRLVTAVNFQSPQLISGTNLQVGATYGYSNVAPGIDAEVEILGFANGGGLNLIDNDGSLPGNFQPEFDAPGGDAGADFRFTFLVAGTNTPIELDIAAGAIDVDGNNNSIREYAEFSIDSLAEVVLNNPTQLDMNASGPSSSDRVRFESRTTLVAPGIDPTAVENIVTTLYSDIESFEYRVGALGPGSQTRLTSLDFNCPNLQTPIPTPITPEDFGDAPASYGNPSHILVSGIQLGSVVNADSGPFNDPNAAADTGDDSVGSLFFIPASSTSLMVPAVGAGGRLQGWVDWDQNGVFDDPGERIATNVQDGDGDGFVLVDVSTPASASLGTTFARFRWSTVADVGPDEPTEDGEVEDFTVAVNGTASISVQKSVLVYDPDTLGLFAVPGNEVIYTISVTNIGNAPIDPDGIFVLDELPSELEFFSGDVDGPSGPAAGALSFADAGSSLLFNLTDDVGYSDASTPPADFSDCNYSPVSLYDAAVRFICVNPSGTMASGNPDPGFSVMFRARIQ